jgi:hypothetical protein
MILEDVGVSLPRMQVAEKHHTDRNQARVRLAAATWPALLFVICVGFFWKLTLTDQYTWLDTPEVANQLLPSYQYQAGEWHARRMPPLWDLYNSRPLLSQPQTGAAYPLHWLLFLAPLRNGWIRQSYLHWYFVLIHFQASLFFYWLSRDLNRSRGASLLSGLAFGLGGFIGTNSWPPTLNAAAWTPLVLLFFLRAMRGQSPVASAAWSGACLGITFLSGDSQIPMLTCIVMAVAWLCCLRYDRIKLLLIFCLFVILVSGLQTYRGVWSPASGTFLLHFGFCVLTAYGIDNYRSASNPVKRALTMLLCGASATAALVIWVLHMARIPAEPRLGMIVLTGLFLAAILSAWSHERITERSAVTMLTMVMLLALGNITTYRYQPRAEEKTLLKTLSEHSDIAEFLSYQIGPVRVDVDAHDIPYNFGDWYGIDQLGVVASTRAAMLYGTSFQVSRSPSRPDQVEVFKGRSGVKVYQNRGAFPRSRIVHELADPTNFDPSRQTFARGAPPSLETCQGTERVNIVARRSNRVALEADLKCRGMVIEGDAFDPDWVATIDGKPVPIYEAYGFLRGVVVESGVHHIEMRYRPKSVYWGAAFTVAGLLGAAGLRLWNML